MHTRSLTTARCPVAWSCSHRQVSHLTPYQELSSGSLEEREVVSTARASPAFLLIVVHSPGPRTINTPLASDLLRSPPHTPPPASLIHPRKQPENPCRFFFSPCPPFESRGGQLVCIFTPSTIWKLSWADGG